jgi:2-C-methyl-D-erythritol 4-phosphate cytidylyltransferase
VAALDGLPALEVEEFSALVASLAERFPVETLEAPAGARRVGGADDVRVLEALTTP